VVADHKAASSSHAPVLLTSNGRPFPRDGAGGRAREMPRQIPRDWATTRALELMGMRWNLLILREVFAGVHRFRQLERSLGIPRHTLARRLRLLVRQGLIERRPGSVTGRFEYFPTEMGLGLYPVLTALGMWGERNFRALAESAVAA
jgi:DNA-binding HxlR family transcriptional regulator